MQGDRKLAFLKKKKSDKDDILGEEIPFDWNKAAVMGSSR